MKRIELSWNDITKEKQEEIRETLQLDPNDDNCWIYFFYDEEDE